MERPPNERGPPAPNNDKDELVPVSNVVTMNNSATPQTPSGVTLRYGVASDKYDSALAPGTVCTPWYPEGPPDPACTGMGTLGVCTAP